MNPSDSIRQQADAAEQRGMAFFNKLCKQSPEISLAERNEDLSMDISSANSSTPNTRCPTDKLPVSQKFHPHFASPLSSPSHLSSHPKDSYTRVSSPGGVGRNAIERVTVTFSFFLPSTKVPALPMTLSPSIYLHQVKTMVCKKISTSTRKAFLPSSISVFLNGRELKDASTLSDAAVINGTYLQVRARADEGGRGHSDSFVEGSSRVTESLQGPFFHTPQHKEGDSFADTGGLMTATSGPPSSIKHQPSPFPFTPSTPHPRDLSDLSFSAVATGPRPFHTQDQMRSLHRNSSSYNDFDDTRAGASTNVRLTSTQKISPGGAVMSEEAAFYEILEGVMVSDEKSTIRRGETFGGVEQQAQLAEDYAREVADRYEATLSQLSLRTDPRVHGLLLLDLEDLRVERDLWTLAGSLLVQGLLKDIQDEPNEQALQLYLSSLLPSATLEEVINRSMLTDERIRKGRVLRDWLEGCSTDQVHELPVPVEDSPEVFPWTETLARLKARGAQEQQRKGSPKGVSHVHPDAQLGPACLLIPLDGGDHTNQETLLKVVWQLIRSGQLVKAQELAHTHKVHWLTAAMMGVAEEFYACGGSEELDDEDAGEVGVAQVTRRGNKNRPLWIQACWKYSSALSSNEANRTVVPSQTGGKGGTAVASQVAVLEAAIYAALGTDYATLKESVLLQSFADHLWARVRCAHERQIALVSSQFRQRRREFSSLYPGSSDKVIAAEGKYLKDTSQLQSFFSCNSAELVRNMAALKTQSHIASIILQLQAALIQGRSAIGTFIRNDIRAYVLQAKRRNSSEQSGENACVEQCRVLRIFVHMLLWLRHSCEQHHELQALVPSDVLYLTLEAFIACLAERRQFSLVALYCSYLSRPKRLGAYLAMLQVISPTSVRSDEGHIVPAATLHMGGTATLAATLARSGTRAGLGSAGMTCMSLSGRNTGLRGVDDDATAREVLTLAKVFFDEADLAVVTGAVVELARKGALSGTGAGAGAGASAGAGTTCLGATAVDFAASFRHTSTDSLGRKTQGQKSATFTSQTASTTVVPGCYDEGTIPAEDAARMETLRWLCYYEDQCMDAAKEANAFLRAFMIESSGAKTLQVRVLMTNILPSDFITAGGESLQLRLDREQDPGARRALEDGWDAEVGQLQLWKYADWSIHCFENFQKDVRDITAKQAACVGDAHASSSSLSGLKHQLVRSADRCLKTIRKALVCGERGMEVDAGSGQYFEDSSSAREDELGCDFEDRGGFLAIWCTSVDTSVAAVLHLLVGHLAAVQENRDVDVDSGAGDVVDSVLGECFSILEQLEELPAVSELGEGSMAALFSPPAGLDLVRARLEEARELIAGAGAGFRGSIFDLSCVLEKARDLLASVQHNRQAMRLLASLLFRHYLEVCSSTAVLLESLHCPPGEVLQWLQQAADVAVLLADEAEDRQLYKALALPDLQRLLAGVGTAHTNILRIQKSFDVAGSAR